ncbi:MAG: hypothetical protein SF028_10780 [Candidatus Sumerlaeia bacterium]|nr:hypothetical protein [Candidatus Sumerlaeia bacterium]
MSQAKKTREEMQRREERDYSGLTLAFVVGVGASIISTIALFVTKLL